MGQSSKCFSMAPTAAMGFTVARAEMRRIDRETFYDWPRTWELVRELQPDACLFSDAGPDVRWVGNERGVAGETCWATLNRERLSFRAGPIKLA